MRIQKPLQRHGFTLMEIMVVIIVIAVLASVAGPMIGSITDQGKASATKAQMQNVKTALVNYNNDLGKFPFTGSVATTQTAYNAADSAGLGTTFDTNVLVSNTTTTSINLGIVQTTYNKRWKGPYMDSDPGEFMVDAWESKIRYMYYNKMIYLHSYGADGTNQFSDAVANLNQDSTDDIIMSVSRVKF